MSALSLLALAALGNMKDVLEPHKLPPANCKYGCDAWVNQKASWWRDGKVPADAGNLCAQPGAAVNTAPYGAWCYCAPAPAEEAQAQAQPVGTPASWDNFGSMVCTVTERQFGETPPKGFAYETEAPFQNVLYVADTTVDLKTCEAMCEALDNCVYVAHATKDGSSKCYLHEWCEGQVARDDYETWHNSAKSVPPAPTPPATNWGYCQSRISTPEQVNLQIASPTAVVVSFVTFEAAMPTKPPQVRVTNPDGTTLTIDGVTHLHKSPSGKRLTYIHFVALESLAPRATYKYVVISAAGIESDAFSFRAPYGADDKDATRINIYGDMGIYSWNNVEWLQRDCAAGTSDLIIQAGDHAYNMGQGDEKRADGYMNGMQDVVANCPWLPQLGNHEYYDGEELSRILDMSWETYGPLDALKGDARAKGAFKGRSTATTSLGYLLSAGNHHGAGVQGAHPSNTSRYFSVDVGRVHLVALDLNGYFGTDPCGKACNDAQMAWLREDLARANANRDAVPWVVAFAHYPIFCTGCNGAQFVGEYYDSAAAETWGNANRTAAGLWKANKKVQRHAERLRDAGQPPVLKADSKGAVEAFDPVFTEFGVDMFVAGHWHYYESVFPAKRGPDGCPSCAEPLQKDFNAPQVTVHVTTGNGGPPGQDNFNENCPGPDCGSIPATRKQSVDYGYGRLIAHNATHMTFQQYLNKDGTLFDEFTLYQPTHGPFKAQQ